METLERKIHVEFSIPERIFELQRLSKIWEEGVIDLAGLKRIYLFNEVAFADLDELRIAKGGDDLSAGNQGQPLDTIEVRVLNSHHTTVGKELQIPRVET